MTSAERLAAWIVTGPVGHLAAGAVDFAVLFWRLGSARARARFRSSSGR